MGRLNYFQKYISDNKFLTLKRKLFKRALNIPKSTKIDSTEKIMSSKFNQINEIK